MLNFIDSSDVGHWLWAIEGKTLDPHFHPGLYNSFGGGQLAVLSKGGKPALAQPFYDQGHGWIGNAHNFGGPVGDFAHVTEFQQEFDHWKSKHGFNERCVLNPTMRQVVSHAEDLISRPVVYVDLKRIDSIRATTRHMIRRAAEAGAETKLVPNSIENSAKFQQIYNDLMEKKNAAPHWIYKPGFFHKVLNNLSEKSALFLTTINGRVEGGCVLIFSPGICYYHWAARLGTDPKDGVNHFQVWSIIQWCLDKGFQWLLLGGGVKPDDGLFKFKAGFSEKRLACLSYVTYAQKVVSCQS